MTAFFTRFRHKEDGAVTVDWVVLTAAIVTLGAVVGVAVGSGAETLADSTGSALGTATVPTVSF